MTALLERLKMRPDIELAVVSPGGRREDHFKLDHVEYFTVKAPFFRLVQRRLGVSRTVPPGESQLRRYAAIVNDWNPDVVHVHGTELGFGLIKARGLIDKPVAVSIQGLMGPCSSKAYGDLLPAEVHGALRLVIGFKPLCLRRWKSFVDRIPAEEAVLRSADMVLGRTHWDHAWAWAYRPDGRYRHVEEIMRPEFYEAAPWSMANCRRYQVFCTSQDQPLKGLHVLLEAVHILRSVFPEIKLNVACDGFAPHPGNDYGRFVWRLIRKWKLENVITFCGFLDAVGIVEQLKQANCYVTPSFIENGCNALQEAMLVGTPCVASEAGGMLSMIDPERTGMMFAAGDAALLAWQVARIFREEDTATKLGMEARIVAKKRNDPALVEEQLLRAYKELAGLSQSRGR
jgi:glycosyltransferase involved in cell wall biosynthesis